MQHFIFILIAAALGFWIGGYLNLLSTRFALLSESPPFSSVMLRISTAAVLALSVFFVDYSTEWFISLPFVVALITICFLDFRYKVIPDFITLPGILLTTVLRSWIHPLPFLNYVSAALFGAGIFYAIGLIMQLSSKSDSVGGGDIKLLGLTGLVLGVKLSLLSFVLFCLAGMITGIIIVITGRSQKNMLIPVGPFIAGASLICYLWGNDFESWLISNLIL